MEMYEIKSAKYRIQNTKQMSPEKFAVRLNYEFGQAKSCVRMANKLTRPI